MDVEPLQTAVHALRCLMSVGTEPVDVSRNMLQIHRVTTETMTNGAMKQRVGREVQARRGAVTDFKTPAHPQPPPGGFPREDR